MWIIETIAEYTGITDEAELREIYDIMADNVRSFGSLDKAGWRREIRAARALIAYLNSDAGKAEWAALEAQCGAL